MMNAIRLSTDVADHKSTLAHSGLKLHTFHSIPSSPSKKYWPSVTGGLSTKRANFSSDEHQNDTSVRWAGSVHSEWRLTPTGYN